jgi:isopentenyldiphosphate isomerase
MTSEEIVNVYDEQGRVIGAEPRRAAKASGRAVGAVNVLLADGQGRVLLQRRPPHKENGTRWDKSVGGHVGAGEDFDLAARREASEELFDTPAAPQVLLAESDADFARLAAELDLRRHVLFKRVGLQRNLRDVRVAPDGGVRNVLYHVALYLGLSELPEDAFRPQPSEVAELRYLPAAEVDALLLRGSLAPNMAFLWLTQARALLRLADAVPR